MTKKFAYIVILVVAVVVGWKVYGMSGQNRVGSEQMERASKAELLSFVVERPYLVAQGINLDGAEVWTVPTGTEMTADAYVKIGDMVLATTSMSAGGTQTWRLEIPTEPVSATEIFVKGFNTIRGEVGRISLPEKGATEIHDALWFNEEKIQVKIGETKSLQGVDVRVVKILEDSRCPMDAQCIWAGQVRVEVVLKAGTKFQTVEMKSTVGRVFNGKTIVLSDVLPLKKAGQEVKNSEYLLTFVVERE